MCCKSKQTKEQEKIGLKKKIMKMPENSKQQKKN